MKGKVESVMRINDSFNPQVTASPAKPVDPKPKPPGTGDETEISRRDATELTGLTARVMQGLSDSNPNRAVRVQQLKALYESGAYETSAKAITGALVDAGLGQDQVK